mmetsp:Transcript_42602/g.100037  ORF Transcript_42602/g.100037 Transcript_42602/m.100037 type:complete len:375 (+) Transcript_42602:679-1803(+)
MPTALRDGGGGEDLAEHVELLVHELLVHQNLIRAQLQLLDDGPQDLRVVVLLGELVLLLLVLDVLLVLLLDEVVPVGVGLERVVLVDKGREELLGDVLVAELLAHLREGDHVAVLELRKQLEHLGLGRELEPLVVLLVAHEDLHRAHEAAVHLLREHELDDVVKIGALRALVRGLHLAVAVHDDGDREREHEERHEEDEGVVEEDRVQLVVRKEHRGVREPDREPEHHVDRVQAVGELRDQPPEEDDADGREHKDHDEEHDRELHEPVAHQLQCVRELPEERVHAQVLEDADHRDEHIEAVDRKVALDGHHRRREVHGQPVVHRDLFFSDQQVAHARVRNDVDPYDHDDQEEREVDEVDDVPEAVEVGPPVLLA